MVLAYMVQEGVSLREALVKVILVVMMMMVMVMVLMMINDFVQLQIFKTKLFDFTGEVKTRCEAQRWIPPTADRVGKTLPGRHLFSLIFSSYGTELYNQTSRGLLERFSAKP